MTDIRDWEEKRFGILEIDRRMYYRMTNEENRLFLGHMRIMKIEEDIFMNTIKFFGFSQYFDTCEEGNESPTYRVDVRMDDDGSLEMVDVRLVKYKQIYVLEDKLGRRMDMLIEKIGKEDE
jgi:hypothetical protein